MPSLDPYEIQIDWKGYATRGICRFKMRCRPGGKVLTARGTLLVRVRGFLSLLSSWWLSHRHRDTHEIAPLQPYQAAAWGCREHNRLGRQPAGALHRQPALPTSTSCTPSCKLLHYARYPRPDDDPRALVFLALDLRTIGSQLAALIF